MENTDYLGKLEMVEPTSFLGMLKLFNRAGTEPSDIDKH